jgi:hypothetical protein
MLRAMIVAVAVLAAAFLFWGCDSGAEQVRGDYRVLKTREWQVGPNRHVLGVNVLRTREPGSNAEALAGRVAADHQKHYGVFVKYDVIFVRFYKAPPIASYNLTAECVVWPGEVWCGGGRGD